MYTNLSMCVFIMLLNTPKQCKTLYKLMLPSDNDKPYVLSFSNSHCWVPHVRVDFVTLLSSSAGTGTEPLSMTKIMYNGYRIWINEALTQRRSILFSIGRQEYVTKRTEAAGLPISDAKTTENLSSEVKMTWTNSKKFAHPVIPIVYTLIAKLTRHTRDPAPYGGVVHTSEIFGGSYMCKNSGTDVKR